ncbi:MAG TPA: hypothetical protein VF598_10655 [Hymenobacter sp.]
MSKVKQDADGIFVQTGGYIFRPGGVNGHDHAVEMDDGGLSKGDDVKARHMGGTELAKITLDNGDVKYWHAALPDDHRRRENMSPPTAQELADRDQLLAGLGITNVAPAVVRPYAVSYELKDRRLMPAGEVSATSYEAALVEAKDKHLPKFFEGTDHSDILAVVVIGPEADMARGRSVRRYDYHTLKEIMPTWQGQNKPQATKKKPI